MKKTHIFILVTLLLLTGYGYLWGSYFFEENRFRISLRITSTGLDKPSSVTRFKGHYVATELKANRLALSEDLSFTNISYFDPAVVGKTFSSPHFLAVTPWDTLLISNGWGKSIVEIADLDGSGWKEFHGDTKGFNAPHGLCVDSNGWIYVGDSLHSRLVRFKDMEGGNFQEFADHDRLIAYTRQLVCKGGTVWVSNSYEPRKGLNRGVGANVLRIEDFASGRAEVIYSNPSTNITGILPLETSLLVAEWTTLQQIVDVDLLNGENRTIPGSRCALGAPYGLFEEEDGSFLAAYFGDFEMNRGGLALYRR